MPSSAKVARADVASPDSGEIHFEGRDLLNLSPRELRAARREMQTVFQDPFASLNPRTRVEEIVQEPLAIHEPALTKDQREAKSLEVLKRVGLGPDALCKLPHEFSGGQRIGIAARSS
jgi:microcin C transport system ATP-binding protein